MYAIFRKEFSSNFFLFFIDCYDGPRVKDQTPSQIQEMLEVIYDRMQYF